MEDIKEFYINGEPIKTDIGECYFVTVRQYPSFIKFLPYLQLRQFEIIEHIKKIDVDLANELKQFSLFELIIMLKDVFEIYTSYKELFEFVFKNDVFDLIQTKEEFEKYKSLIMSMNCIEEEEKSPNPEIQYFLDLEKTYKQKKNNITYESMYTSVWKEFGNPNDMTLYQFYANFGRISKFKDHDTTVLYSSVSNEVNVVSWYEHYDLFSTKKKQTLKDFTNNAKKIMS